MTRNKGKVMKENKTAKNTRIFDVKVYGEAKHYPGHRALSDFVIHAKNKLEAGRIARRNYTKKYGGMKITHVEIGGVRRWPGFGEAV